MYLSMFVSQLPVAIVSLIGAGLVMTRWKTRSRGLGWALGGFGLSFILCLVSPLSQVFFFRGMLSAGSGGSAEYTSIMTIMALFWSVLRALSYAMLAMAVFIGHAPAPSRSAR